VSDGDRTDLIEHLSGIVRDVKQQDQIRWQEKGIVSDMKYRELILSNPNDVYVLRHRMVDSASPCDCFSDRDVLSYQLECFG
jgi:hypothetical protein